MFNMTVLLLFRQHSYTPLALLVYSFFLSGGAESSYSGFHWHLCPHTEVDKSQCNSAVCLTIWNIFLHSSTSPPSHCVCSQTSWFNFQPLHILVEVVLTKQFKLHNCRPGHVHGGYRMLLLCWNPSQNDDILLPHQCEICSEDMMNQESFCAASFWIEAMSNMDWQIEQRMDWQETSKFVGVITALTMLLQNTWGYSVMLTAGMFLCSIFCCHGVIRMFGMWLYSTTIPRHCKPRWWKIT